MVEITARLDLNTSDGKQKLSSDLAVIKNQLLKLTGETGITTDGDLNKFEELARKSRWCDGCL